ncbi:MAG: SDR family oxidoreductase [Proteobacteria bacterium]|nr:SDR family oxidoreductase [Pseudomonadota bacterium]HQR03067.1 SDR family oxidoreductase [Rhodocyclaceae bacterium]
MKLDFTGKRAVVSGSTSGIGFAIAQQLCLSGAAVTITGRVQEHVDHAVESIHKAGCDLSIQGVMADLGTAVGAATLIERVPEADILINNLGIFEWREFFQTSDEDWERMFQVNVMSGVRLSRHYAQGMMKRGWGRVQFVSSEAAVQTPPEMVHYGVSKTAQLGLSRGLAESLAGTGVTVNAILPGPTRTTGADEFFERLGREQGISAALAESEFVVRNRPSSLIRRMATAEEVAYMSVFLASEQASVTTGDAIRVDGGIVRSIL